MKEKNKASQNKHGGRRYGAGRPVGRPTKGNVPVKLMFPPEVNVSLTKAAQAIGMTKSDYVKEAILEKLRKKP